MFDVGRHFLLTRSLKPARFARHVSYRQVVEKMKCWRALLLVVSRSACRRSVWALGGWTAWGRRMRSGRGRPRPRCCPSRTWRSGSLRAPLELRKVDSWEVSGEMLSGALAVTLDLVWFDPLHEHQLYPFIVIIITTTTSGRSGRKCVYNKCILKLVL